jgi:hypothetical protein
MYNKLVEYFPLMMTVLGGLIWGLRLEGEVKMNKRLTSNAQADIDTLRVKHEALDSKVLEKISQIQQTVARIEGMLEARNEHL